MMYEIDVQNDMAFPVNADRLQQAALAALEHEGAQDGSALTIVVTGNDDVAALNRQYRGVDAPTDVLSFPYDPMPGEAPYLGDLVIAYPYTAAQAEREGLALPDNLLLLVVHGTLHLIGYDHDSPEHRAEMWLVQEAALLALGISPEIVPALENGVHDETEG